MASWNDKQYNSQLRKCPICPCSVANKKFQKHVEECYKRNEVQMKSVGIIQCPASEYHILPIAFLNHHLDGNCQGVLNILRKFYQKEELLKPVEAPPGYRSDIPDKYLNQHNRNLLYMIDMDLYGNFDQERDERAREAERDAAASDAVPQDVD